MKVFNSLKEMIPYYNSKNNTYEVEDDVYFKFDLAITANISAFDIKAFDIKAFDIKANNIIAVYNIKAKNINAKDITFYAVCFASDNFECESIIGIRKNSKYFCLDNEVIVKNAKKE